MASALLQRVDHLIVRIDDPYYAKLHDLLVNTLQLPTSWPVNQQPGFKSGGVYLGNVDLELLRLGRASVGPVSPQANLYGLVFESQRPPNQIQQDLKELRRRKIAYFPSPYLQKDEDGQRQLWWMNIFLADLLGSNLWMKLLFGYKKLFPNRLWLWMARHSTPHSALATRYMFDWVFGDGSVFLVKYNPEWRDIDAERRHSQAELKAKGGGPLGLLGVKRVVLSVKNKVRYARWARLLGVPAQDKASVWQPGDGPAVEIRRGAENRLLSMVWQVRSLPEARAFLDTKDLLGTASEDEIRLDPAGAFNLDIRLVAG